MSLAGFFGGLFVGAGGSGRPKDRNYRAPAKPAAFDEDESTPLALFGDDTCHDDDVQLPALSDDDSTDLVLSSSQGGFEDDQALSATQDFAEVNPATGLVMIGGIGGIDTDGNLYGMDLHHHDHDSAWSSDPWESTHSCHEDPLSSSSDFDCSSSSSHDWEH